jgi:hypothetical protein
LHLLGILYALLGQGSIRQCNEGFLSSIVSFHWLRMFHSYEALVRFS